MRCPHCESKLLRNDKNEPNSATGVFAAARVTVSSMGSPSKIAVSLGCCRKAMEWLADDTPHFHYSL